MAQAVSHGIRRGEIIAIDSPKGGVGKTTTAVNLAYALALTGRQTLLIDLDPQASASTLWEIRDRHPDLHIVRAIRKAFAEPDPHSLPLEACILKTRLENFQIVTGHLSLKDIELELIRQPMGELVLKRLLKGVREKYDYIVIDNKPDRGPLNTASLAAATRLIIPIEPAQFAMQSLADSWKTLLATIAVTNAGLLDQIRILITKVVKRDGVLQAKEYIQSGFGEKMFNTYIRIHAPLEDAAKGFLTIFEFDQAKKRKGRGSQDYQALAEELISIAESETKEAVAQ